MKRFSIVLIVVVLTAITSVASAKMAVGGYLGAGFSFMAGDGPETIGGDRDDRTGKFSGAIGGYFDYYFTPMIAIEAGLGFHSHGIHYKDDEWFTKMRHFYMEIPVLVRIDISNFQIGAGLALSFALSGKSSWDLPIVGDDAETWDGSDWDGFNRVNIGPKFYVGYAIPVGPVVLVPHLSWSIHLVNDIDRSEYEDLPNYDSADYRARYNNLLLNIAVEYRIP